MKYFPKVPLSETKLFYNKIKNSLEDKHKLHKQAHDHKLKYK